MQLSRVNQLCVADITFVRLQQEFVYVAVITSGARVMQALERLAPAVETERRRLARLYLSKERAGHTLEPRALVNEAYVRLIGWDAVEWQNRAHSYALAAKMPISFLPTRH
jgi:hypothetical protein